MERARGPAHAATAATARADGGSRLSEINAERPDHRSISVDEQAEVGLPKEHDVKGAARQVSVEHLQAACPLVSALVPLPNWTTRRRLAACSPHSGDRS